MASGATAVTGRSRLEELAHRSLATRAEAAAQKDVFLWDGSERSLNIPATPLLVVPAGSREARAVRLQEQNGFIRTPSGRELRIDPETGLAVENESSFATSKVAASRVVSSGLKLVKKEYSKFKKNKMPVHLFKGKRGSKNEQAEDGDDDGDSDGLPKTATRRGSSEELLSQSFSEFGKRLSVKEGDAPRRKSLIKKEDDGDHYDDDEVRSYSRDFGYNNHDSDTEKRRRMRKSLSPDHSMSRSYNAGESRRRSRSTSNNSRHSKQPKHKDVVDRRHHSFNDGSSSNSNLRRVPRRGKKPQNRQLRPPFSQSFSDFHYSGPSDDNRAKATSDRRSGSRDRESKRSGDRGSRTTSINGSRRSSSRDRSRSASSGDSRRRRRSSSTQRHNQHIQMKKEEFLSRLSNSCPSGSIVFFDWAAAAAAAASEEEEIQSRRRTQQQQQHRRNNSCDESGGHSLNRDKNKHGYSNKRNEKSYSKSAPRLQYHHHDMGDKKEEESTTKQHLSRTRRKPRRSTSSPEEGLLSDKTKKRTQRLANHQRSKSEARVPAMDKKNPFEDIVALARFHDSAPTTTTKSSFMKQLEKEMAKTEASSKKKKSSSKKSMKKSKVKKKDKEKKVSPMELSWFGLPTANDIDTTATTISKQASTNSLSSSTNSDSIDDVSFDDSDSDSVSDDCLAADTSSEGRENNNLERSMSILDLMDDDADGEERSHSNNSSSS